MSGGIFGDDDRQNPLGRVRFVDFKDESRRTEPAGFMKSKSRQKKRVSAPSGHMYVFRKRGDASEWHTVNANRPQDVEFFENDDRFEVERNP